MLFIWLWFTQTHNFRFIESMWLSFLPSFKFYLQWHFWHPMQKNSTPWLLMIIFSCKKMLPMIFFIVARILLLFITWRHHISVKFNIFLTFILCFGSAIFSMLPFLLSFYSFFPTKLIQLSWTLTSSNTISNSFSSFALS